MRPKLDVHLRGAFLGDSDFLQPKVVILVQMKLVCHVAVFREIKPRQSDSGWCAHSSWPTDCVCRHKYGERSNFQAAKAEFAARLYIGCAFEYRPERILPDLMRVLEKCHVRLMIQWDAVDAANN